MAAAFKLARAGDDRDRQIIAEFDMACRDNGACGEVRVQGYFLLSARTMPVRALRSNPV
jgi:hypothetical protein